jgi:hypothetical protein
MTQTDSNSGPTVRQQILSLLATLASAEDQRQYQRSVGFVHVPSELVCQWFDNWYHPDDENFRACFTTDELELLARFHHEFDDQLKQVPLEGEEIGDLLNNKHWKRVTTAARTALDGLQAHAE